MCFPVFVVMLLFIAVGVVVILMFSIEFGFMIGCECFFRGLKCEDNGFCSLVFFFIFFSVVYL